MTSIKNPILPGFHPDPSIVRVGDDYYLATSTFEWYPGVCIYHSTDLVNWQLVARPLATLDMLDMRGNPDSCGVWAPCLSYSAGRFYLAFTNTRRFAGDFKDTPNFITSAESIDGPWSTPILVNSSGFDPSIFHDVNGNSYWLNMVWDHRPATGRNNFLPHSYFGGIVCQQINLDSGELLGEPNLIFTGSPIGLAEGPHLYQRDGYYYLLVAEGGTGKNHAVTVARSDSILGPYQVSPHGPLVTSAGKPNTSIKRAGHGDWVETPDGKVALVHLCSRPLPYRGRSVMGRETALQWVDWQDGAWPTLESGDNAPAESIECDVNSLPTRITENVDFSDHVLPNSYHSLRYPLPDSILNYAARPGYMRLTGQESLGSWFEQSLVARRQQAFCYQYQAEFEFAPRHFQQMAGLVCYYNSQKYIYLHVTHDEALGKVLDLSLCSASWHSQYPMKQAIAIKPDEPIALRVTVNYDLATFEFKIGASEWCALPFELDYSELSDEFGDGGADANFTGAFVGICCQDLSGQGGYADFKTLSYIESEGEQA